MTSAAEAGCAKPVEPYRVSGSGSAQANHPVSDEMKQLKLVHHANSMPVHPRHGIGLFFATLAFAQAPFRPVTIHKLTDNVLHGRGRAAFHHHQSSERLIALRKNRGTMASISSMSGI